MCQPFLAGSSELDAEDWVCIESTLQGDLDERVSMLPLVVLSKMASRKSQLPLFNSLISLNY